jgi:hypothetical protein
MPKPEPPYFVLVCSDAELRRQLQICEASSFRIVHDRETGGVTVYDRGTVLLRTEHFGGGWLVWLRRLYYRHPFGPPSDGSAPPGVP